MLGSGGNMKHYWESDNEVQPGGKVLASCKACGIQGEVIYIYVYPMNHISNSSPIPDNCSGKREVK